MLRDHLVEKVFMKNDEITQQEEDETALAQINGPLLDLNYPETWTKPRNRFTVWFVNDVYC